MVSTHTSNGKERKINDTDTTKGNSPHKLLINRLIPEIIPVVIPPVNQTTTDGVAASGRDLHAVHRVLSKDIVVGVSRSAARIFEGPPVVNLKDTGETTPREKSTVGITPRATTPVRVGTGPLVSPTRMGSQDIGGPRRFIVPQEVSNTDTLDASINGIYSKHTDPAPTWSKLISSKFSKESSSNIYYHFRMNRASDNVLRESPNFMDLGMSYFNTTDELGSVFFPTTRIGYPTHGSKWITRSHFISEATADKVSGEKSSTTIILKVILKLVKEKC